MDCHAALAMTDIIIKFGTRFVSVQPTEELFWKAKEINFNTTLVSNSCHKLTNNKKASIISNNFCIALTYRQSHEFNIRCNTLDINRINHNTVSVLIQQHKISITFV